MTTKRRGERKRVILEAGGDTPTQQNQRDFVNINAIVARYKSSRELNHVTQKQPLYGNFDLGLDLAETLDRVAIAHDRFMQLDADIRAVADNKESVFLDLMATEEGMERLEAAGLRIEGRTPPTQPANPPPSPAESEAEETTPPPESEEVPSE